MTAYGWDVDYIRKRLPGAQGWVYYFWALSNEANGLGERRTLKTDGYIKQERERQWATNKAS